MAPRILAENYANKGGQNIKLSYDPINGNTEIIGDVTTGVRVYFSNGAFTNEGKLIYSSDEQKQILSRVQNDVRAAATTVNGKTQEWAKNPATAAPTPATPATPITPGQENPFANVSPESLDNLKDQLKDFGDKNDFSGLPKFLKYPSTIDNGQDRIFIEQIEYVTSGITGADNITNVINLLGNRESQFAKSKSKGFVVLPIPNELSETNTTGWGESSLSSIAAALMKDASTAAQGAAGGDARKAFEGLMGMGGTALSPEVKNRLTQYLTANAGASILKLGGINVDPEAFITRVTGTAINPNLELLFNGPKLRQFGFSFKMTPRNSDEAKQIRGIVKFFKKGMAPRRSTSQTNAVFLGTPNVFKITFKSAGEIGGIGKIKTCALVSCGVNYTPDGFYAAYSDSNSGSQPITTVLSLAFTELTPIYNDDYDAEDASTALNSIGPEINTKYNVETPIPQPGDPNFIGPVPDLAARTRATAPRPRPGVSPNTGLGLDNL